MILPFYLLIDVSWSMTGKKIEAANELLPELVDVLRRNPVLADIIKFSVIDFSGDATVVVPLGDPSQLDRLPTLECRTDGTHYAAAFELLARTIQDDVEQLKADGFKVHRPAVFFISDGEPNDDETERMKAFEGLTKYDKESGQGFAYYPNMIPFAIDEADPKMLLRFVYPPGRMRLFVQREDANPAQAIAGMAKILKDSMLSSGKQGRFVLDDKNLAGVEAVAVPPGANEEEI
jgi:uncharacterized protein YegL